MRCPSTSNFTSSFAPASSTSSTPIRTRSGASPARSNDCMNRALRANASSAGSPTERAIASDSDAAARRRAPPVLRSSIAIVASSRARVAMSSAGSSARVRSASVDDPAGEARVVVVGPDGGDVERGEHPRGQHGVADLLGERDRVGAVCPGPVERTGHRQRPNQAHDQLEPRADGTAVGGERGLPQPRRLVRGETALGPLRRDAGDSGGTRAVGQEEVVREGGDVVG